ncbi:MAG: hypothetical protein CMO26_07840, partial [Thiotrichales bacterium]|nr:hypothetical protein [Thiotrichales bacterium]
MAYYDATTVSRIKRIKQLQRTRYLPLKVIKEILVDNAPSASDDQQVSETIIRVMRLNDTSDAIT